MDKTPVSTKQWKLRLKQSPRSPALSSTSPQASSPATTPKRQSRSSLCPTFLLWNHELSQGGPDVVWDTTSPSAHHVAVSTTGRTPIRRRSSGDSTSIPCKKSIVTFSNEYDPAFAEDLEKLNELVKSEIEAVKTEPGNQVQTEYDTETLAEALDDTDEAADDILSESVLQMTQFAEEQYIKCRSIRVTEPEPELNCSLMTNNESPRLEKNGISDSSPFDDDSMDNLLCDALDNIENVKSSNVAEAKPHVPEPSSTDDDFFQPEVLEFISQIETSANLQRKATIDEIERKRQEAIRRRRQRMLTKK